jgi:alkylation response protein AidB-like acyl-CoA dehydrogenase
MVAGAASMPKIDEQLVKRASDLVPELLQRAPEAEALGRVSDETVMALEEAGIVRIGGPIEFGGHHASFRTQQEVLAEVARGCGSSSWVAGIYVMCSWLFPTFSDKAQDDVYAAGLDPRGAGVFSANSKASPVSGGYELTGRWPFCTGQHHAQWMLVPAPIAQEGEGVEIAFFLVPRKEFGKEGDWDVAGLAATGSNTLTIDGAFVPEHRVLPLSASLSGQGINNRFKDDPYYHVPVVIYFSAVGAGTALGLGRAALDIFRDRVHKRGITYTAYGKQSEAAITHHQMAEAVMKYDEALFHGHRAADTLDSMTSTGAEWDLETRIRTRADAAECVRLCKEVVDVVQSASGASQIHRKDPLQRIVRDMHAFSVHSQFLLSSNRELYGRFLCGLEPTSPWF